MNIPLLIDWWRCGIGTRQIGGILRVASGVALIGRTLALAYGILVRRNGDPLLDLSWRFDDRGEKAGDEVPINMAVESPDA